MIQFAKKQKIESGRSLRADTTVTRTNIAYPVDARLLWDSVRVLTRLMRRIITIDQCEPRVLKGEKVPAEHKIVSIFEEHTDIICRGKSMSPTEFGHKVLFTTVNPA